MPELSTNLPQNLYTAQQVRENEPLVAKSQNIEIYQLMELAGQAVFDLYQSYYSGKQLLVVAGKGNNGGDAYVVARLATEHKIPVMLIQLTDSCELTGDAKRAYEHWLESAGTEKEVKRAIPKAIDAENTVIIDGMFGTGFYGSPNGVYLDSIAAINALKENGAAVISIDLPSGINADTGDAKEECVIADKTVTFIAVKQGLVTGNGINCVGQLYFAGLTVASVFEQAVQPSVSFINKNQLMPVLPKRRSNTNKHQLGHVLCIGGGKGMAGAIRLSAEAALYSGAGLVSVATHPENVLSVISGRPELMVSGINQIQDLMTLIDRASVLVLGPGLGRTEWAKEIVEHVITVDKPKVIDADALYWLSKNMSNVEQNSYLNNDSVITPHVGEAARLLNQSSKVVEEKRYLSVAQLQALGQGVALLKGVGSLVSNGVETKVNRSGSPVMATAGMGDVLSGIIAALVAQGMDSFSATQLAVTIHGEAAEKAAGGIQRGLLASELFIYIRSLLNDMPLETEY